MSLRPSKWIFKTSNSGAASLGIFGGEGGTITLLGPDEKLVKFAYGALGVGYGKAISMPKIGKVQMPGVTGSSELFDSGGAVYLAPGFAGKELAESDISGACTFIELSAGLTWGASGYAMGIGMNPALFAAFPVVPAYVAKSLMKDIKGYIIFKGTNYGLQGGASVGAFVGYMRAL